MPDPIKPVIVLGLARTGTTGLVNAIYRNFELACLSHPLHYGAHEIKPIYNTIYWGDLKVDANWSHFIDEYETCDAFVLSHLHPDQAGEWRGDDFIDFIFNLMDTMTTSQSTQSWVMKVEPEVLWFPQGQSFLEKLHNRYGPVDFLVPKRAFSAYLNSYVHMPGRSMSLRRRGLGFLIALMLGGARFGVFWRNIGQLSSYGHKVKQVEFDQITNRDEGFLSELEKGFSLKRRKNQLKAHLANSSQVNIKDELGSVAFAFARLCRSKVISNAILWGFHKMKKLPKPLSYRLQLLDQDPESLKKQLVASGDKTLIDLL